MTIPVAHVVALAVVLFAIGAFGVLVRRNLVFMLLSVLLMLNAANLALIGFGRLHGGAGGALAICVMFVAVAEVGIGLAVIVAWLRNRHTLDVDDVSALRW